MLKKEMHLQMFFKMLNVSVLVKKKKVDNLQYNFFQPLHRQQDRKAFFLSPT